VLPIICIAGAGRSGKDYASKWLNDNTRWTFTKSTSMHCADYVYTRMRCRGINYPSIQECYGDRINHRPFWDQCIRDYNSEDPCRMYREMIEEGQTIIQRCCKPDEVDALRAAKLVDLFVWIDRDNLPPDSSQAFDAKYCDLSIYNPVTYNDLIIPGPTFEERLERFATLAGAIT
jgi:hypothetical protein